MRKSLGPSYSHARRAPARFHAHRLVEGERHLDAVAVAEAVVRIRIDQNPLHAHDEGRRRRAVMAQRHIHLAPFVPDAAAPGAEAVRHHPYRSRRAEIGGKKMAEQQPRAPRAARIRRHYVVSRHRPVVADQQFDGGRTALRGHRYRQAVFERHMEDIDRPHLQILQTRSSRCATVTASSGFCVSSEPNSLCDGCGVMVQITPTASPRLQLWSPSPRFSTKPVI